MDDEHTWIKITGHEIMLTMCVNDSDSWDVAHRAMHLVRRRMEIRQLILDQISAQPETTVSGIIQRFFTSRGPIPDS